MKVWVVTKAEEFDDGDCEKYIAVCATQLDALGAIEADGGNIIETRALAVRYTIGKARWSDAVDPFAISLEYGYRRGNWWNGHEHVLNDDSTRWAVQDTWYVHEVEMFGFDREAALAAITAHDAAHGWIVPLPDYDHVHRVKPDEQGTGGDRDD